MSDLKQYKKQRKKLKQEIKSTEAHLKRLKHELRSLREGQQHQVIEEELDQLMEKPSLFKNLMKLFDKS
ncbi:hypothetical protein GZ77_07695 [Endozoicomonas montiporae]|uniref:Uncharacterized protein n=2 Tax=Endozoicomonas montiporae TaxID=1027273 RepID=A0A081N762_9GAMM|nr:DUF342 domain-containing protein [Endozoicomonas montiporae]AMO55897.1 hypothetical protein EZMO1_1748 [Endozoicomonas montiporae CL-33]KEQ14285.1 hypothetical protein GZ77_07695 [Endozoicomonas montiporae]